MKKITLSILLMSFAVITYAQRGELEDGKKNWNIFELLSRTPVQNSNDFEKRMKTLAEGVEHIDKASQNEKTKKMSEVWAYKSLYSYAISTLDTVNTVNALTNEKNGAEALAKAKELATTPADRSFIKVIDDYATRTYNTKGFRAYMNKDINSAYNYFNILVEKNPADTSMLKNSGLLAVELKKYPEAIKNFKKAIDLNISESKILYSSIIAIQLANQKDTTAALNVLNEAKVKYPNEINFISVEADIYLRKGNNVKAEELVDKLLAKDDKNPDYKIVKANLYFNNAFEAQNKAAALNKAKKTKEADAEMAKMKALLDKALPYYEKALELRPKDKSVANALKQIYGIKGNEAKYNEMKKLSELN